MYRTLLIIGISLAAPAYGQTVYKCPTPDGKISYQRAKCPEGGRMVIQDNGKSSGDENQTSLRPGEQALLNDSQKREQAERQAATKADAKTQPAIQPSVTKSEAWRGLDKIQQESTATINSLTRMLK